MRSTFLGLAALLLSALCCAQTTNLQLGYQEFPTTILGQVADAQGNLYYTGTFRGELKVNGQVLETGRGLDDIFWVKTDASGKVLRYKTFGSTGADFTLQDNLVMNANGTLTFFARVNEPVSFGSFTLSPYQLSRGLMPATCLVTTDTSGQVLWAHRTTMVISRLFAANNTIHAFGSLGVNSPSLQVNDRTVMDSSAKTGVVHFMFDQAGNFLNYKTMSVRKSPHGISLPEVSSLGPDRLFVSLRLSADSSFLLNGAPVSLPASQHNYYVFLTLDTSYSNYAAKVLNPTRTTLSWGTTLVPATTSADSVYALLSPENGWGDYSIDGRPIPLSHNALVVMDPALKVGRTVILGPSNAIYTNYTASKRRLYFRKLLVKDGSIFYTGLYVGANESPINAIPARDTNIAVLPGLATAVNLNGGSRSFVARTNLGATSSKLYWYGDHTHSESYNLAPLFLRSVGPSRLGFVQNMDNLWNPWIIDTDLNVVLGSMKRNVDLPETAQMIQFFPDGSRIVIGHARGRTAMDSTDNTVRNTANRWEAFICRINAAGQVLWFRRPYSTLQAAEIRKLVVRGNKAYFLVGYSNSVNDTNYIRVGNEVYPVTGFQGSLLASVDMSGNVSVLNLKNPAIRNAFLRDFSFFANGDVAVLANQYNQVPLPSFPSGSGFYLFRVDSSGTQLLEARKINSANFAIPDVKRMEVDGQDSMYIYATLTPLVTPNNIRLNMYNGSSVVDTMTVILNSSGPMHNGLLKLSMGGFSWFQRFNGPAGVQGRQSQELFLVHNKPVILAYPQVVDQPLYWGSQLVHSGVELNRATLVQLTPEGRYQRHKTIGGLYVLNARKGSGERLHLSGYTTAPAQIDTITLGHAGYSDAVGIVVDSLFTAKRSFRLSSPYSENLLDFDIYHDSLATFAYTAQTSPQLSNARMMAQTSDYEEDAYTGTYVLKTQTTTGINDPLPLGTSISVAPNPVTGRKVTIVAQTPEALSTTCYLYAANGQFVGSKTLRLTGGNSRHEWRLPAAVKPGAYYMMLTNKKWSTTRPVMVL
jgi:hypothetical protein